MPPLGSIDGFCEICQELVSGPCNLANCENLPINKTQPFGTPSPHERYGYIFRDDRDKEPEGFIGELDHGDPDSGTINFR